MKGKSLKIGLAQSLGSLKEVLEEKGHEVIWLPLELESYDLLVSPNGTRFLPGMEKYLDALIKGVRLVKYLKKETK